jgi:hypothetical protein
MLLLFTRGSPPSYLLLSAYKGPFLVCLKVLILLFIFSLFNFSREYYLHPSDVEVQLMDVVDDMMTHVELTVVY